MKGKTKWSLLLVLMFVMSIFLSACGGNGGGSSKGNGSKSGKGNTSGSSQMAKTQTLNINIAQEPPSLDPSQATDSTSFTVLKSVFSGLMRIGKGGKPVNDIAKSVSTSSDGKTWTIKLRNAKWSNGDPVTAQDFVYEWKHVLNPKTGAAYAYQMYPIKNAAKINDPKSHMSVDKLGVKAVDSHTLKIQLERPTPYFKQLLAFPTFYPVDPKVVKANPKWASDAGQNYVTDGPFTLNKWQHKNQVVLKKNPKYWNASKVHLQTINMEMVNDSNTELTQYKSGQLDWAGSPTGNIPLAAIPSLKSSGKLHIKPIAGVYYYAFNVKDPIFKDKNMRYAFSLAIDRNSIVKNVTKGGQIPAMALVPPSMWPSNKKGYFKDNNLAKAKQYLKKGLKDLGYSSVSQLPPITLSYNTSDAHKAIAVAIQNMWKQNLGVNVKLYNAEWKVYLDRMQKGNFQIGRMGWLGDFNDPINFLEIFKTVGGNNYTNWHNAQYKQLLDKSYTESGSQRTATMKKAEKIFMKDMPIAPIYFYTNVWLQKPYVKGVVLDGLGSVDYTWAYIAKH